ncbi:TasA family protein [Halorussus marinus]|uniref:TasA family protein n=1 Tax=Halorussus marinus TaxID=2505976 RepID=UPI00106DE29C|nr:TasA family protein [Halorussus marinus]
MTDDDNSGFDLSRRKVLGGVLTVGAASAATGAGTMALFSDTESSNNNSVSAGTLNLTNDGSSDWNLLQVSGAAPGDAGSGTQKLKNTGSITGDLKMKVTRFESNENGVNEAEASDDPNGTVDSPGSDGELDENLKVYVRYKGPNGSTTDLYGSGTSQSNMVKASKISQGHSKTLGQLAENDVGTLEVDYKIPSGVDNKIQSDSVEADVKFTLEQPSN